MNNAASDEPGGTSLLWNEVEEVLAQTGMERPDQDELRHVENSQPPDVDEFGALVSGLRDHVQRLVLDSADPTMPIGVARHVANHEASLTMALAVLRFGQHWPVAAESILAGLEPDRLCDCTDNARAIHDHLTAARDSGE